MDPEFKKNFVYHFIYYKLCTLISHKTYVHFEPVCYVVNFLSKKYQKIKPISYHSLIFIVS